MNKEIIAIALLTIMLSTVPAFALPTQADAQSGGSIPPVVKAKAEWLSDTISLWDDDPTKPFLQINPSGIVDVSRTLGYVIVATDSDGYDDLSAAYADVYHPNECWKYQVALPHVVSCTDNTGELADWISNQSHVGYLYELAARNLLTLGAGFTLEDVIKELEQCSAKLFTGTAQMDYCQMCGQFTWQRSCPSQQCGDWIASNFDEGYRVEAYVYDKTGAESPHVTNFYEYMCKAGLETDFEMLDFESVRYQIHKWIEGDRIWDETKGPACKLGTSCVGPTIRNTGNMPLTGVGILQDDMQFSYSGPSTNKDWNVLWDARIGDYNDNPVVNYLPNEQATAVGPIDLCELDKISFSIYVKKMASTGSHVGTVELTALPATFPWWNPDVCNASCVTPCISGECPGQLQCVSGCCLGV